LYDPYRRVTGANLLLEVRQRRVEMREHLVGRGVEALSGGHTGLARGVDRRGEAAAGVRSACSQHEGLAARIDDREIDERRDVVALALDQIGAEDGHVRD